MKRTRMPRLASMLTRLAPRHKPMLATIYGDALMLRAGAASTASLISAGALFGINARAVRTALRRLCADGIVASYSYGRRSDYRLTDHGHELFAKASERIYDGPQDRGEKWHLVLTAGLSPQARSLLWQELSWHGFASLGTNVLMGPARPGEISRALSSAGLASNQAAVVKADFDDVDGFMNLVRNNWKLGAVEKMYAKFIAVFRPLAELAAADSITRNPQYCFAMRILMVNTYRRILIKDPGLPASLLPEQWPGHTARELCCQAYPALLVASEEYITSSFATADGVLPAASNELYGRFSNTSDSRFAAASGK